MVAAIEIFNKPQFAYRDETFAILALNAWELLLKAKVIADNKNDERAIFVYEPRTTASGATSKKLYLRRSRSGNPQTIGLGRAIVKLDANASSRLPSEVKGNLDALIEIRDNAVHYFNASPLLAKQTLEVGTASVKNFVHLGSRWFTLDLMRYKLSLMPIGFIDGSASAEGIVISPEEKLVLEFVSSLIEKQSKAAGADFHVAMEVRLQLKRAIGTGTIAVMPTNDPSALQVVMSEEDILKSWPWSYDELSSQCRKRYSDFKQNSSYHTMRKKLESNPKLARIRFLDPANPNSGKKTFYSANILAEFDKQYNRK